MAKENKNEIIKPQKYHIIISERGSNKGTMRKPRLPPARSLEITECRPYGQHSRRYFDTIQKPVMILPCGKWKVEMGHSEMWCENGSRVKRQKPQRRSEATQIPLRCALSIFSVEEDSSAHEGHPGEWGPAGWRNTLPKRQ